MDPVVVHVVAVVFIATLIRSSLGFGEALVAVPLLALRIPVREAAPLAVLVSITVAAIVMLREWRHVQVRSASWLVAATLAGIPLGLALVTRVDPHVVKAMLAVVILAFALHSLVTRTMAHLRSDELRWLLGFGFIAGVLGGAYGMNGPPLVVYGTLRRWSAAHFRATLQAYFLPASILGMLGYWLAGLWVPVVTRYYLLSLPAVLVATWLGTILTRRVHDQRFHRYVFGALVVVGVLLLAQSFHG